MTWEEEIVEAPGGALTMMCSPHLENIVVTFVPPEAVAVSLTGKVVPRAETLSVFDSFGEELVAAVVHLRTYSLVPVVMWVDSFVPLAFGSTVVIEEIVTTDLRSEYWLVPAFQDTQFVPTFFASAELSPSIVVSPEEFPLT